MTDALLVVDAQRSMFEPDPVHDANVVLSRLQSLVFAARRGGVPIVFIRNNGGVGEVDEPGTDGWQVHPSLVVDDADTIIDKDDLDAFTSAGLVEHMQRVGASTVVVAGLQSGHCISATCAGAIGIGLTPVLVGDAHSTYDGDRPATAFIDETNRRWARDATVVTTTEAIKRW